MNFRNISAWSIRNPVPSLVLFVALTLAGIVSFMRMDVNQDPDIDFPVAIVVISQPGAAPTELETQVTQRVEAAVRSLQGIDQIESSVTEGQSQTVIQLNIGTPIDRAVQDVREAVNQIRGDLPEGILEPQVFRANTTDNDMASFTAIAPDMTIEQLSWYVDNTVAKELLSVPGLSAVDRIGGVNREIRVVLDPTRLQSMGLTASQVNQALRQVNLNAAGGRAEIAGSEQSVRVIGDAQTAYDLGQTQIPVAGRSVRLSDIAQVRDSIAERRSNAEYNGGQVVAFDIKRAKGESDVAVFHGAQEKLKALNERNPKVQFELLFNNVKYVEAQYETAITAMIEGAVLAVIVVFFFLRDWRATIISSLAIPLSAIPAFWFMDLMGFTLNQMTLLALSLVAGVLVDDAIVEIENIVRHMRMGKSAYQASIDAADEIGMAVLATTMAIVAVFLPVGMMPGISGQFFKNFGLTVVAAVLVSLAVARLITPMLAAYFLKAKGHAEHGEGWAMDRYVGLLRWSLNHDRAGQVAAKGRFNRFVVAPLLDHRLWVMGLGAVAMVATAALLMVLPQTFQPTQDQDNSTATIEMVPGTTLAQTQAVVDRVKDILAAQPVVTDTYARAFVGNGRVTAMLAEDKKMTSVEFERSLAPEFNKIPDARVAFRSQMGWGSGGRDLSITLGGEDPVVLNDTANKIMAEMTTLPMVVAPRVSGDMKRPEITIRPRLDLAASLGVTTQALSSAIRIATLGDIDQNSARFSLNDRQIPIRVALSEDAREKLSTIENLPVPTNAGGSVPLRVVADIGFGAGPTRIDRINQQRRLMIGADLAPGVVSGEAMKAIDALPTMKNLPIGVNRLTLGQAKWQGEMINNFIIAVISGILLVFAVLVLLYKRIMPPFVNMGSLLLAPLGGLLALWITGNPISMPVYIGLLMLLGIVAKNSILLIDFALEEMEQGVDKFTAIVDAGHKRAQPIVMTTVAMVFGMLPTALSLSGDGSWRAPMGITVIGGLIVSTILTLVIVPATFSLAVGIERWVGPRLSKRLLTYRPGDGDPVGPMLDHTPGGRIPYRPGQGDVGTQPAE
ncbi:efflux RND transporter permease subunit [Sphingomonas sp. 37zxx]|uniref:efflux RND transporter permease subunit n=1 Tax=Sphingomonas sp. 37zxx TaxID=1550073 RepID=UPI00053BF977|nr:efflux RND transporter permease subunit [Sphingomonas sp. 37zxx]